METQRLPEGVELSYTDRAVHLTTNGALMTYLRQRGNGSLPLSRMILDGYAAEHGAQLHITERSMATELLIHAYLDGIFDRWMRAGEAHGHQDRRLYKTAKRLKNATAVIDMGERASTRTGGSSTCLPTATGFSASCWEAGREESL